MVVTETVSQIVSDTAPLIRKNAQQVQDRIDASRSMTRSSRELHNVVGKLRIDEQFSPSSDSDVSSVT